jgi:hypothetical protein
LRSAERVSHQGTETTAGGEGSDFFEADLPLLFALEGVTTFPFGFPPDLEAEEGVLRGMRFILAQMVCYSSSAHLING